MVFVQGLVLPFLQDKNCGTLHIFWFHYQILKKKLGMYLFGLVRMSWVGLRHDGSTWAAETLIQPPESAALSFSDVAMWQ